jgi:hypothetical protein
MPGCFVDLADQITGRSVSELDGGRPRDVFEEDIICRGHLRAGADSLRAGGNPAMRCPGDRLLVKDSMTPHAHVGSPGTGTDPQARHSGRDADPGL